jgi:hypothetical protein
MAEELKFPFRVPGVLVPNIDTRAAQDVPDSLISPFSTLLRYEAPEQGRLAYREDSSKKVSSIYKKTKVVDGVPSQEWLANEDPGDQLYGQIDWRGSEVTFIKGESEIKFTPIISFHGPSTRNVPCNYVYGSQDTAEYSEQGIYYGGMWLTKAPAVVLGAALRQHSITKEWWIIAICKNDLSPFGETVFIRKLHEPVPPTQMTLVVSDQLLQTFQSIDVPDPWKIVKHIPGEDWVTKGTILDHKLPWMASGDGLEFSCVRYFMMTHDNGHMEVEEEATVLASIFMKETADSLVVNSTTAVNEGETYEVKWSCEKTHNSEVKRTGYSKKLRLAESALSEADRKAFLLTPGPGFAFDIIDTDNELKRVIGNADHWWVIEQLDGILSTQGEVLFAVDFRDNVKLSYYLAMEGEMQVGYQWGTSNDWLGNMQQLFDENSGDIDLAFSGWELGKELYKKYGFSYRAQYHLLGAGLSFTGGEVAYPWKINDRFYLSGFSSLNVWRLAWEDDGAAGSKTALTGSRVLIYPTTYEDYAPEGNWGSAIGFSSASYCYGREQSLLITPRVDLNEVTDAGDGIGDFGGSMYGPNNDSHVWPWWAQRYAYDTGKSQILDPAYTDADGSSLVTTAPYLGDGSTQPILKAKDLGVFVVVKENGIEKKRVPVYEEDMLLESGLDSIPKAEPHSFDKYVTRLRNLIYLDARPKDDVFWAAMVSLVEMNGKPYAGESATTVLPLSDEQYLHVNIPKRTTEAGLSVNPKHKTVVLEKEDNHWGVDGYPAYGTWSYYHYPQYAAGSTAIYWAGSPIADVPLPPMDTDEAWGMYHLLYGLDIWSDSGLTPNARGTPVDFSRDEAIYSSSQGGVFNEDKVTPDLVVDPKPMSYFQNSPLFFNEEVYLGFPTFNEVLDKRVVDKVEGEFAWDGTEYLFAVNITYTDRNNAEQSKYIDYFSGTDGTLDSIEINDYNHYPVGVV